MNRTDKYIALARRVANQTEEERNEALRNTDPALARALEEIMRIKLVGDDEEHQGEEAG